ncbi:apolipoprotein N-acyltransferase [Nitrosovibrio sp. Nv4]|uniref:apolipoprotein N-acyltransferase n=1 Tax=Nitrosovibrio sp. Nv4 TaxID=1945880 RepID=UPI000BD56990|nr:apolipoprotein N-acyltransferase [Nitrosovibrio sp. Nv4]SOD40753.1 Apolipoprotein N-acyltransferase [Nitrosovibrio sp. Nv4]
MSKNTIRTQLSISFLIGALTVLGFAPFYLFPIPLFTLALLCHFWRRSATPFNAALLGFTFGMGMFSAGVTWIYVSLHDFGGMPMAAAVIALIVLCAYLALFPAAAGWILKKLRIASPSVWLLAAGALWGLSDWLRSVLFTGFPWLTLGYSQAPQSPLAGFAPVTGVYGVSMILVSSSALICLLFEREFRQKKYLFTLLAIWVTGFGLQHIQWTKPQGEPVTVSLLQGNISQDLKWRADQLVSSLERYAALTLESKSRLIVTPEISIPLARDEVSSSYLAQLATHARQNDGDILVGMVEVPRGSSGGSGGNGYYNSMFSFGASPDQSYRKHHLVPFGEFIPLKFLFGWVTEVFPLSDFSRGGLDQKPLNIAGQRVAVNICYEDVFGEEIIQQLPQATLLANVSNDAWFGRSIGPRQHLQISQMRALETGRYMLRATNTGVTAIINERGKVLQEAEVFTTTALHGIAQGFTGATPYVRFGNSLMLGLAGIILLIAVLPVSRGRRKNL